MRRLNLILMLTLILVVISTAYAARVQVNNVPATVSDLVVNLTTINTPSAAQAITAAGDAILANATIVVVNPDADYTLTSTPTIANGTTGQVVFITAANGEANTITIQDQDTLASTNLELLSAVRSVTAKTQIMLFFDGTNWVEIGSNQLGAFTARNDTDSTTGFQVLDADGGTPILNVDTTNEGVGIGIAGPDRTLDVLDASNPQLRLTHTDGTVYTDFQTDANGDLIITPSGADMSLDTAVSGDVRFKFINRNQNSINRDNIFVFQHGELRNGGKVVGGRDDVYNDAATADSNMQFWTATNGVDIEAMRIDSDQHVTIGPGIKHDGYVARAPAEVQTTDAVQTTLDSITLLDENVYTVQAFVAASQSDGTDEAGYIISCVARRTGGGGATVSTTYSQMTDESNVALDATFTVSGNDLRLSVTGIAAETWEWGTTLKYINMSN